MTKNKASQNDMNCTKEVLVSMRSLRCADIRLQCSLKTQVKKLQTAGPSSRLSAHKSLMPSDLAAVLSGKACHCKFVGFKLVKRLRN